MFPDGNKFFHTYLRDKHKNKNKRERERENMKQPTRHYKLFLPSIIQNSIGNEKKRGQKDHQENLTSLFHSNLIYFLIYLESQRLVNILCSLLMHLCLFLSPSLSLFPFFMCLSTRERERERERVLKQSSLVILCKWVSSSIWFFDPFFHY